MYEHVTRGCGELTYRVESATEGRVTLLGFPASRYDFPCYLEGLAGCADATISMCNLRGSDEVVAEDASRGDVEYRVCWSD